MIFRAFTFDAPSKRDTKTLRGKFKPSPTAERDFYRQLKKIAQAAGHIIERHVEPHAATLIPAKEEMQRELREYARLIGPWAERHAAKMIKTVADSNKSAYTKKSRLIGRLLNVHFAEQPVGAISRALITEQVALIQSIPIEAGLRAQKIAYEAFFTGSRADETAEKLQELGLTTEVTTSRALMIARTETARANAAINQARATSAGSGQYRWHNSGDAAVRDSHRVYEGRALQGRIFDWDDPPTLSDGMTGNPGEFPNCRCFAEPIFPDE